MKTDTSTLIAALEILSRTIKSDDGTAEAALAEAAERMQELAVRNDALADALRGVMNHIAITGDYAAFEKARAALGGV